MFFCFHHLGNSNGVSVRYGVVFALLLFLVLLSLHAHAHPREKLKNFMYVFIRTDFVCAQHKFSFHIQLLSSNGKFSQMKMCWLLYKNMQIHIAAFQIAGVFSLSSFLQARHCSAKKTEQVKQFLKQVASWHETFSFREKGGKIKKREKNRPKLKKENTNRKKCGWKHLLNQFIPQKESERAQKHSFTHSFFSNVWESINSSKWLPNRRKPKWCQLTYITCAPFN